MRYLSQKIHGLIQGGVINVIMITQENLRRAVWNIKRDKNMTFKQMAEDLGVSYKSLLNWQKGLYDFGEKRTEQLIDLIYYYQGVE